MQSKPFWKFALKHSKREHWGTVVQKHTPDINVKTKAHTF